MKVKKKTKKEELESVKMRKSIVDLVRDNKEKTRVPIGAFFEQLAIEKLKQ